MISPDLRDPVQFRAKPAPVFLPNGIIIDGHSAASKAFGAPLLKRFGFGPVVRLHVADNNVHALGHFALGAAFIGLEIHEFSLLIAQGYGPERSAFLSAFFTLVGTHGLHVTVGLIWMVILAVQVIGNKKVTQRDLTRLTCLSLFWHFLDIVWICVFTFVYLTSVV